MKITIIKPLDFNTKDIVLMKNNSFPQNVEEKHYFMFSLIFLMFGFIEGSWTCILTFAFYLLLCYVSHNAWGSPLNENKKANKVSVLS